MSAAEEIIIETPEEEIDQNVPVLMKITPTGIKTEFETSNGKKIFKNIGLNSLARVLNRDNEFDTGFLPLYGSNYIGIKRYIKMGDKELIFIEASPANRNVDFSGRDGVEKVEGVRFPGLLMGVVCRVTDSGDLDVRDTRLYATKGPILRETDELFRFPFGNVYSDGRICWGGVNYSRGINNLTSAGSLLTEFLRNTMNNDLQSGNVLTKLKSLKDSAEYPYAELRDHNMSFRSLISLFKGKNIG